MLELSALVSGGVPVVVAGEKPVLCQILNRRDWLISATRKTRPDPSRTGMLERIPAQRQIRHDLYPQAPMTVPPLASLPIPDRLATSIDTMAPAYLRRRLNLAGAPYQDGDTTTFVYVGRADAVRIATFMSLFPPIPPLAQVAGTDVWTVTVRLPTSARVEYKIEVTAEGKTEAIIDPLNPVTALDPFGANSVTHGPGYALPEWAEGAPYRSGAVEKLEIRSQAFDRTCTVGVYRPPVGDVTAPMPLVVIHDASDLVTFADVRTALDGLILGGFTRPFTAVLLDPVHRDVEYAASEQHSRFVVEEVLPAVRTDLGGAAPAAVIVAGASLGGVAALATGVHHPGVVHDLIVLSGSFVTALGGPWNRGPLFEPVIGFMSDFSTGSIKPADRIWMACGAFESLAADNRALVPVLEAHGSDVSYQEPPDGHHWVSWRDSLGEALIDLIGDR